MAFFFLAGFFITWTPYAVVCIYIIFYGDITPLGASLPAFFAKTSLTWPALLTIFTNRNISRKLWGFKKQQKNFNGKNEMFKVAQ